MPQVQPPQSRRNGSKAKYYTDLKKRVYKMERDEWRAWYKECLDNLPKNSEVWNWLNRNPVWAPKRRGKFGNQIGRPLDDIKKETPDTRNMNWDEI